VIVEKEAACRGLVAVREAAVDAGSSWSSGGGATAGGCRGTDDRECRQHGHHLAAHPPGVARVLVLEEALYPTESHTERAKQ
jgi:hypothetical protein